MRVRGLDGCICTARRFARTCSLLAEGLVTTTSQASPSWCSRTVRHPPASLKGTALTLAYRINPRSRGHAPLIPPPPSGACRYPDLAGRMHEDRVQPDLCPDSRSPLLRSFHGDKHPRSFASNSRDGGVSDASAMEEVGGVVLHI